MNAAAGMIAMQARIVAIQGRVAPAAVVNVPSATGSTRSGGNDFAATLAKLTPGANDGSTGSLAELFPGAMAGGAAASGDQVVADARGYLGVPYVWGGNDPAKGLDCSGLVQRAYTDLGIDLPRVSPDPALVRTPVPIPGPPAPGDLGAFRPPAVHIGSSTANHQLIRRPPPVALPSGVVGHPTPRPVPLSGRQWRCTRWRGPFGLGVALGRGGRGQPAAGGANQPRKT